MQYSLQQKEAVRLHPIQEQWLIFQYRICNEWLPLFKKNVATRFFFSISCIALFGLLSYSAFGYVRDATFTSPSMAESNADVTLPPPHLGAQHTTAYNATHHHAYPGQTDESFKAQPISTLKSVPIFVPLYFFGIGFFLVMKCGWIRTQRREKNGSR